MSKLTAAETMTEGGCLCPECGWKGGPTPTRRLWHWRRLGPILLTGGAFVGFVVWLWLTSGTVKVSSGTMVPRFVDSGFSQTQVEAIARAEQTEGDFARMVLDAAHATVYSRDIKEAWRRGRLPQTRRTTFVVEIKRVADPLDVDRYH